MLTVPAELVRPIVQDMCDRYGAEKAALMLGIAQRRLWEIRKRQQTVTFHTADRIVVGALGPHGWHTDADLAAWYETAN